jgi:hypothetical protein
MVSVPHLLTEDALKKLSKAFEKLEGELKVDIKDLFDGVNEENDELL